MRFEGAADLIAKLNRLDKEMRGQVLTDATVLGAEVLKEESKRIVPYKTGNLQGSITSEVAERSDNAVYVAVGYGPQAPYGYHIELGTSRMPARPFLRPPLMTHGEEAKDMAAASLEASLSRHA